MMTNILALNLYNPGHISGWLSIILLSIILGMVHGITPDEHTWPITFSYAIGSYSTKKGLRAGLIFSAAFTLQRAIASELAYLGLSRLYVFAGLNSFVYIIVGLLMAIAGFFIIKKKSIFHLELPFLKRHHEEDKFSQQWLQDPRPWMPAVHGFVAGWGFGAFALILYTVISPATHSVLFAWVPGALFGIGTMIMQVLAGALFGYIASHKGLSEKSIRKIALLTAGNTLSYGGLAFILGGLLGVIAPSIANANISTGLHIHNLAHIGLSIILVILSVVVVGLTTLIVETRQEVKKLNTY